MFDGATLEHLQIAATAILVLSVGFVAHADSRLVPELIEGLKWGDDISTIKRKLPQLVEVKDCDDERIRKFWSSRGKSCAYWETFQYRMGSDDYRLRVRLAEGSNTGLAMVSLEQFEILERWPREKQVGRTSKKCAQTKAMLETSHGPAILNRESNDGDRLWLSYRWEIWPQSTLYLNCTSESSGKSTVAISYERNVS
jgi:hypothetical protein